MLAETAHKVPGAVLVQDDALRVASHVSASSVDLALLHYLTTYVDSSEVLAGVVQVLRPGGLLSMASTTYEAFPTIAAAAVELVGESGLRRLNPAPESGDVLRTALTSAGLEVVQTDSFDAEVTFARLPDLLRWGRESGFLTHVLDNLPAGVEAHLQQLEHRFPVRDRYRASVLLARKPS
jgi:hypothetical protein